MKWKEDLYTLNRKGLLAPQDLEALLLLPKLRDEVFFPDYHAFGYIAKETEYQAINEKFNMYRLDVSLSSPKAQRYLDLAFLFQPGEDINHSVIGNRIYRTDSPFMIGNAIDMYLLISSRTERSIDRSFGRLSRYSGDTHLRIKKSFEQIRYYYDHVAADIISGENWVMNAQESYEQLD